MLGRNASGRSNDRLAADEYASVWTFNYCEDGHLLLKTTAGSKPHGIAHNVYYVTKRTPVSALQPLDPLHIDHILRAPEAFDLPVLDVEPHELIQLRAELHRATD